MEQKPDFKKAYILANDMLVAARCISFFPFDAAEFVKEQTDLKFCSYKRALEKFGLDCRDLGSGSAVLAKRKGKNIVFYNQDEYDAREPFNRLHETGHFLMEGLKSATEMALLILTYSLRCKLSYQTVRAATSCSPRTNSAVPKSEDFITAEL